MDAFGSLIPALIMLQQPPQQPVEPTSPGANDVLAGLPAPFDGEPASVRQDIADELADHLACAYRRELLLTADPQAAERNALAKFGDPRRIARQLWLQALWGRLMLAKLKLAVPWLKYAAVAVFAWSWMMVMEQVSIMRTQSVMMAQQTTSLQNDAIRQEALLQQVLQRLPQPPGADGMLAHSISTPRTGSWPDWMAPEMPATVSAALFEPADDTVPPGGFLLKLVDTQSPPQPVHGCLVALAREDGSRVTPAPQPAVSIPTTGMTGATFYPGMSATPMLQYAEGGLTVRQEDLGRVRFPTVEPGRYRLFIEFPDGRMCDHRLVIAPGASPEARQLTITCPASDQRSQAYVVFELPPVFQESRVETPLHAEVHLVAVSAPPGQIEWQNSQDARRLTLHFDPVTGVVTRYARWNHNVTNNPFRLQGASVLPDVYLGDVQREERFIAVPCGRYQAEITLQMPGSVKLERIPVVGDTVEGVLTITPETKTFKFEGPPGWQETLLKKLGIQPKPATTETSDDNTDPRRTP